MAKNIEKMIADTFMEMAQGLETGSFGNDQRLRLPVWEVSTEKRILWQLQKRLQRMELMCSISELWKQMV